MTTDVDIAICGAGPVGLTLAALLHKQGVAPGRIALFDAKPLDQVACDPRSIALSYGSGQILQQAKAWPVAARPIHQIHVSRRGHFGRTLIDCDEYQLPALGYVTRYGALVRTLTAAVAAANIAISRPTSIVTAKEHPHAVDLQLADARKFTAGILVQAEGGLFADQGAKTLRRAYEQVAVVAEVHCSAPRAQCAFERFTDEGPLALLPQEEGYALVWCARPASATRLMALPDSAFLTELAHVFGSRLGRFTLVSQRNAYPLGLNAHPASSARTIAIGNAAQTLHPVAGQGLNLGLRDATVLARLLAQEATPAMLARFLQARQSDRSMTIALTDAMARVFTRGGPGGAFAQTALGLSLGVLDAFKPAQRLLAEHMLFGWRP